MDINKEKLKATFDSFLETRVVPLDVKYKAAIWAAALILPVVVFVFLFYSPKTNEIKGLEKRKISLSREISEAKARANELEKHKAEMAETQEKFQEVSILLPQKQEIPSLLTSISSLGTNAGLDFVSFHPRAEVKKDFYAEIPVDISVRGPYHNVGNFLYQVSKLDRIVSVTNISLGSPAMEKGEMLLAAKFTLVTYRFLEANVGNDEKGKKDNAAKKKRK